MGAICSKQSQAGSAVCVVRDENGAPKLVLMVRDEYGRVRVVPINVVPNEPAPPLPDSLCEDIIKEASEKKYDTLFKAMESLRGEMNGWAKRSFYVDLAAEHWDLNAPESLDTCPDTAAGNLFKGVYFINRAWDVRGGDLAHKVKESAWPTFQSCLETARDALLRSASQDQEDPTPHANLCGAVAKGLQVESCLKKEWFLEAVKRDPLNEKAHAGRLSNLCRKWGGSHLEMHTFAEETVKKAPQGSTLKMIQYDAFYEQWLFLYSITKNKPETKKFLNDQRIKNISMSLYKEVIEAHTIQDVSDVSPHVRAAQWLLILGAKQEVAKELEKLRPWRKIIEDGIVGKALEDPASIDSLIQQLSA